MRFASASARGGCNWPGGNDRLDVDLQPFEEVDQPLQKKSHHVRSQVEHVVAACTAAVLEISASCLEQHTASLNEMPSTEVGISKPGPVPAAADQCVHRIHAGALAVAGNDLFSLLQITEREIASRKVERCLGLEEVEVQSL